MTNEPLTFTRIVPHGNVSPNRSAMNPENQYRPMPPAPDDPELRRHSCPLVPRSVLALRAQLLPVVEPLQDLALEAALHRLVELAPGHAVRKIVLAGKAFRGVVVVFVALAVAEL